MVLRAVRDLDRAQGDADRALEAPVGHEALVARDLDLLDDHALDQVAVTTGDDPDPTRETEAVMLAEVARDLAQNLDNSRIKKASLDRIRIIFPFIKLFSAIFFVASCLAT